jgi:uncharacterized protein (DUF1800 family)
LTLRAFLALMAALSLAACGSSQPLGGVDSAAPLGDKAQAARFLTQATFGPTLDDINAVGSPKNFDGWLAQQKDAPVSLELPYLSAQNKQFKQSDRIEAWWHNAILGRDQLRQRMAFALSEILVISDQAKPLDNAPDGVAYYYDVLARDGLGNFRDLLEDVTLSPAMGHYLNMFQNRKPEPNNGIRSDENYAREVMQLFTVGLTQLNADGSPRLDSTGNSTPTFSQSDVANLARVLTGWAWAGGTTFYNSPANWTAPMQPYETYHDRDAKVIIGNTAVPAGMNARPELDLALDALFHHPNVGPFIGKQLIERLVTSNPSPAYVARVAGVFNDNGAGVRGDLYAVARAILLDPEARSPTPSVTSDKLREPLLRVTGLWRAFNAKAANGRYDYPQGNTTLDQSPVSAPSVFNFFRPDFSPVGVLSNAGLVAPEFQITNESTAVRLSNELRRLSGLYKTSQGSGSTQAGDVLLDFTAFEADAAQPGNLLDDFNLLLMSGQMPAAMRSTLLDFANAIPADQAGQRIAEVLHLIVTSPQYAAQR